MWYRAAELKPRLRSHAKIHRQRFRGQTWYILQDQASGRFHRFSPDAYFILAMMNGRHTVQEIWEKAGERLGENVPTQDEVLGLLGQLHTADVLQSDVPPDILEVTKRSETQNRRDFLMRIRNPLALRIPLFDPDRFLTLTMGLARPFFSLFGLLAWIALIAYGGVLTALHWDALTANIADRVLATQNILLTVLIYPFVKGLHELGHGYAVKRWSGEVHEMGVMMLVLIPVPYVDASSASVFGGKWSRALVGAAGIMVEMALAVIAVIVWVNVEPGPVRAGAYSLMLIAGVSTLFFNGNPLLRFDGYYVMADLVEIPNLGTRANKYLLYLIQRYFLGIPDLTPTATAPGERLWFVAYGLAAFCYRLFIVLVISTFVATKFFIIGILLAIWAASMMFVFPVIKGVAFVLVGPQLRRRRRRALTLCGTALATVLGALTLIPLPYATVVEGVVWTGQGAAVHAQADGVVAELIAAPNSIVVPGEPLVRLEDPYIGAQVRVYESELAELRLALSAVEVVDRVQGDIVRARLESAQAALALTRERERNLTVLSDGAGRFVPIGDVDLPGRFIRKGEVLAYVIEDGPATVRAVVPQQRIDLVRQRTYDVSIRFVDRMAESVPAAVAREVPAASAQLPSPALAVSGGGGVAVDPRAGQTPMALESLFQLDIRASDPNPGSTIGGRAYVRFDHGSEPVASRLYRLVRQLLLKQFNV